MIVFFRASGSTIYAVSASHPFDKQDFEKLTWLFGGATRLAENSLSGIFVGPRKEMVTPWSTNAVEITQTMGLSGIERMEEFTEVTDVSSPHDAMLQRIYRHLDQETFTIHHQPDPIVEIADISAYNEQEGLALSREEVNYLKGVSKALGRDRKSTRLNSSHITPSRMPSSA